LYFATFKASQQGDRENMIDFPTCLLTADSTGNLGGISGLPIQSDEVRDFTENHSLDMVLKHSIGE
jgi:hypothetical protein